MIVDIFIKTYHKDYVWLEYCLKSIRKFASGFRNIVIVGDHGDIPIPPQYYEGLPVKIVYSAKPARAPTYVEHGLGYLWQQYIKLSWHTLTDADAVLVLDSDWMLTAPTTPTDFMVDGKFAWVFRRWENAGSGICWKKPTEFLLKIPSEYEGMGIAGFILQRETTIALKNCICSLHGVQDIWDIVLKYNLSTFSEFNLFGSFIHAFDRKEYTCLYEPDVTKLHNYTLLASWSWGGLKAEDKAGRDTILSS